MMPDIDFEAVFNAVPRPFLILSPELSVLAVNDAFLRATSMGRSGVLGRTVSDLFNENNAVTGLAFSQNLLASLERVKERKSPDVMPTQMHEIAFPNGERQTRFLSVINSPVLGSNGEIRYVIMRSEDVTDSQLNVFKEERFRTIIEAIPQIVWTARPDGRFDYFNRRWFDYSGTSAVEDWPAVLHPEDLIRLNEHWARAAISGEPFEFELRYRRAADGEYRWHLRRGVPLRNVDGQIVAWLGTCTDIHEQRSTRDVLLRSGEEFRQIAEAIPQLVWRTDVDGTGDYFNHRFLKHVGCTLEQVVGWGWAEVIHPEDRERVRTEIARRMAEANPVSVEFRVRGADGKYRWFLSLGNPFYDEAGKLVKYYGTWTDIEEHRRAKEGAELASKSKSAFLANMSHEIRTPLGVIRGFAELLEESVKLPRDQAEWVTTIRRNAYHLTSLIDELLDLSKIESDRFEVERIKFPLADIIEDVTTLLNYKAKEKGILLRVLSEGLVPKMVTSDPTRLKQILVNLIGNAIKFTEWGGVEVKLKSILNESGFSLLQVTVRDSGIGLTPDQQVRLFQPFMQADTSTTRRFGGTGLGLYISKKLANALGGDLTLKQSALGVGSVFVLTIDCGELAESDYKDQTDMRTRGQSQPTTGAARLRGVRVLLVEDALDNQKLISRFLTMEGAEVRVASNGVEGVVKARTGNQDVILMDIQMPELDGYGATRKLRQEGYFKPIIALTAHAMKEEREQCLRSGFDDHLSKPINRDLLIEAVDRFSKNQRTDMETANSQGIKPENAGI